MQLTLLRSNGTRVWRAYCEPLTYFVRRCVAVMGLSIRYRSVLPMHPARAFEIKKYAAELNEMYAWIGCDQVVVNQSTDGLLGGASTTSFIIDAEFVEEMESSNEESAGDIATLIDVLCELSRAHDVDWEIEHDYEPDVIGCIRNGIADIQVLEELETIRTIGEMLGDFDDDELDEELDDDTSNLRDTSGVSKEVDGPRLLRFPTTD